MNYERLQQNLHRGAFCIHRLTPHALGPYAPISALRLLKLSLELPAGSLVTLKMICFSDIIFTRTVLEIRIVVFLKQATVYLEDVRFGSTSLKDGLGSM